MYLTTSTKCEDFEDLIIVAKPIIFTFLDVTTYDPPHTSRANTYESEPLTLSIKSSTLKGHIKSKFKMNFKLLNLEKVINTR